MYFYTPIFTLFLLDRNLELSLIVATQTVFSLAMMIATVPTGVFADKYGQKIAIQAGLLIDALSMFSLIFVNSTTGIILYFAARGISVAFRAGSDEALLYDSHVAENGSPEGYSKLYGKMISNDVIGFVASTAIAGILVYFFGKSSYIPLIIGTSLASLFALVTASTLKEIKHIEKDAVSLGTISQIKEGLNFLKKNRTVFALTLIILLTINGEYFLRQTYQPFFQDLAVPSIFLGIALSVGKLFNFVVIRNVHRLEKSFTVDKILFGLNVSLGLVFVLFSLWQSSLAVVVLFIIIQALLNAQQPIISDYFNQQIPSNKRSTILSTISLVQNTGEIGTRLLLGASIGMVGLGWTFFAQGIYLIIGAVIGLIFLIKCGCVHKIKHVPSSPNFDLVT